MLLRGIPELAEFDANSSVAKAKALEDMRMELLAGRTRPVQIDSGVVDLARYLSRTKQSRLREVNELDTHRVQVLLREAVGEAYMANFHGRDTVCITEADVYRADYRLLYSDAERDLAKDAANNKEESDTRNQARLDGIALDTRNLVAKTRSESRNAYTTALGLIDSMSRQAYPKPFTLPKTGASPAAKKQWDRAIEHLVKTGVLHDTGDTETAGNGRAMTVYRRLTEPRDDD
jgi:hypothetical protein